MISTRYDLLASQAPLTRQYDGTLDIVKGQVMGVSQTLIAPFRTSEHGFRGIKVATGCGSVWVGGEFAPHEYGARSVTLSIVDQ